MGWTEANFAAATAALDAAQSVLIVTHVSPDGDAIGSALGLVHALRARGLHVEAAVDDGVPSFLHFLEGFDVISGGLSTGTWDLMISVDASDEPRTGKVGAYGRANSRTVINLDHHATNTGFGDIHLVNPDAASACEIVYAWLRAMDTPLSRPIAMALLTGIVTDTLGFRTSNVTTDTLSAAQALIAAGASLAEVAARTLDSRPFVTLNIWRYALQNVHLADGVIYATISRDDLRRADADEQSDVGLSSFLVQTNEARVSAVFKETPEGSVELSMRAKLGYDVSDVAFGLGGGGHKQASGATIPGPLDAAVARVLPLLYDAVRAGQPVYS